MLTLGREISVTSILTSLGLSINLVDPIRKKLPVVVVDILVGLNLFKCKRKLSSYENVLNERKQETAATAKK